MGSSFLSRPQESSNEKGFGSTKQPKTSTVIREMPEGLRNKGERGSQGGGKGGDRSRENVSTHRGKDKGINYREGRKAPPEA